MHSFNLGDIWTEGRSLIDLILFKLGNNFQHLLWCNIELEYKVNFSGCRWFFPGWVCLGGEALSVRWGWGEGAREPARSRCSIRLGKDWGLGKQKWNGKMQGERDGREENMWRTETIYWVSSKLQNIFRNIVSWSNWKFIKCFMKAFVECYKTIKKLGPVMSYASKWLTKKKKWK